MHIDSRHLILACLLLMAGCSSEPETTTDIEPPKVVINGPEADSTGEISASYLAAAENLSGKFQRELKHSLLTSIRDRGAAEAIGACRTTAPALIAADSGEGWNIRRVTDRFRNPDNRADNSELAIMARFQDSVEFAPYISFWSHQDTVWRFHFYEPIRTSKLCLRCHGGIQTLATGVYDALKRDYPGDRATGYKAGEMRGMFVIEADWPSGQKHARMLELDSSSVIPSE